jgi:hypothetical protein
MENNLQHVLLENITEDGKDRIGYGRKEMTTFDRTG